MRKQEKGESVDIFVMALHIIPLLNIVAMVHMP